MHAADGGRQLHVDHTVLHLGETVLQHRNHRHWTPLGSAPTAVGPTLVTTIGGTTVTGGGSAIFTHLTLCP
jgi:hypothetical protein